MKIKELAGSFETMVSTFQNAENPSLHHRLQNIKRKSTLRIIIVVIIII
jgi:hypothetical protein